MIPNTKHVYTWSNEQGAELPVGLMPVHRKGTVCACWNDFTQLWEFLEGDGQMWRTIFNKDAVPAGFRTYLLLLGLS